jgi:hypothetical protein
MEDSEVFFDQNDRNFTSSHAEINDEITSEKSK